MAYTLKDCGDDDDDDLLTADVT